MRIDRTGLAMVLALSTLLDPAAARAQWATDGLPVAAVIGYQDAPAVAPDGAGGAFVAWVDGRGSPTQVYVQRLTASGVPAWTTDGIPARVAPQLSDRAPVIIADGEGGAILAWSSNLGGVKLVAQRLDAAGNRLWGANGVGVCPAAGRQEDPQLVPDGLGGAFIVWRDERNEAAGDLYAQRLSGSGAILWDSAGVPIGVSANQQMRPAAVACADGSALIAWEDYRANPAAGRIYAQLLDSSGAVRWTPNGVSMSPALTAAAEPAIVEDGANGAVLAWVDFRGLPNRAIYAQRLDSAGVALWDSGGVALGVPAANAYDHCAISDGAGGAIVAWAGPIGIHAQRVSAAGSLLYDPSGMRLTNAAGYENMTCIAADGAGGAIVAWRDSRQGGGNFDIYAQRVSAGGERKWEAEGRAVCTSVQPQSIPTIAPRGPGSAIIAWRDFRNGVDDDIYAGCPDVGGDVSVGWEQPAAVRVGALRPNPTRAGTTLSLELSSPQRVSIEVFDMNGRLVRRLAHGRTFAAGSQSVFWDGATDRGVAVPAGVYGVRVRGAGFAAARRVTLIR